MAKFREQAERFGTRIMDVDVERVDLSSVRSGRGHAASSTRADAVIVATGASALWLGLESETRLRGRGVSACATCDGFFFRDKEIAVVGGGDTALEEATYLTRFATKVHLLHRRDAFRASQDHGRPGLRQPEDRDPHEHGRRRGPRRREGRGPARFGTRSPTRSATVPMEGLFVAIGHRPNTEVFKEQLEVDDKGYLVVHDETGLEDRGRVHRRRRPRPPLPPGDHGGRPTAARPRSTPSAGSSPGNQRGDDRDCVVSSA